MREKIIEELKQILVNSLLIDYPMEKVKETDGLQSVIGVDSLGFVELRISAEETFDVEISDEDYTNDNFKSLGNLADLIVKLQAATLEKAS